MRKVSIKKIFKKVQKGDEKKRSIKTAIVVSSLVLSISLGVGIPLGIVNNTTIFTPALPDSDVILNFSGPNNDSNLTIKELLDRAETLNTQRRPIFDRFDSALVRFLYEEERVASENFRAALQQASISNFTAPTAFDVLSPLSEVQRQQQGVIDDLKLNLQQQFGFNNWIPEFNRQLREEDRFGKTGTEAGAVNFLVISQIRTDAFRRFNPQTVSSFTLEELNATVQSDITSTGDIPTLGIKAGDVVYASGSKIFNFINTTSVQDRFQNMVSSGSRAIYFGTNSYIDQYRDASGFIQQYLRTYKNVYLFSALDIPITPNFSDLNQDWTVTKETFKRLALFSRANLAGSDPTFRPIDKLATYRGPSLVEGNGTVTEAIRSQIRLDNFMLSHVASNSNKSNGGLLSFGDLTDFSTALNPGNNNNNNNSTPNATNVTMLYALLEDPKNVNQLIVPSRETDIWTTLSNEIAIEFKDIFESQGINNITNVNNDNLKAQNDLLEKAIDNLDSDTFKTRMNRLLNKTFTTPDPTTGTPSLNLSYYDRTRDVYTVIDTNGIHIVKRHLINTPQNYHQYIINDLMQALEGNSIDRINFNSIQRLSKVTGNERNLLSLIDNNAFEEFTQNLYQNDFDEANASGDANNTFLGQKNTARQFADLTLARSNFDSGSTIATGVQTFVQNSISNNTYSEFRVDNLATLRDVIVGAYDAIISSLPNTEIITEAQTKSSAGSSVKNA